MSNRRAPAEKKTLRKKRVAVSPYARAHRLRLYPTRIQERKLRRAIGAMRYVWNWGRRQCKDALHAGDRIPTDEGLQKRLTLLKREPEHAWLNEIPTDVLQQTLRDLGLGIKRWLAKLGAFPARKKRGCATGIRFSIGDRREPKDRKGPNPRIDIEGRTITLTGMGEVKWRGSRDRLPTGDIAMATVRVQGGRWYVTLPERDTAAPAAAPAAVPAIGIDLGLKSAVVMTIGDPVSAPRPLKAKLAKLRRYQRSYARQRDQQLRLMGLDPNKPIPRGTRIPVSNRARKNAARIGRLHAQVADQRREFQHQLTRKIVDSAQVIAIEDLNVAAMAKGLRRGFRRSVADVGMGEIRRQIEYKAAWAGRTVIRIDRWFPSSKLCGSCGHVYAELNLKHRTWACPACGTEHDRDQNAAYNILREGLRLLAEGVPPGGRGTYARGESSREGSPSPERRLRRTANSSTGRKAASPRRAGMEPARRGAG